MPAEKDLGMAKALREYEADKKKFDSGKLRAKSAPEDDDLRQFEVTPEETGNDDLSQFETGEAVPIAPTAGYGETIGDALMQGLTLGYSDEIMAGIQNPFSDKTYRQLWEQKQEDLRRERRAHPGIYNATELAGNIGGSFIPGIGWVSYGGKILKGAGALRTLGNLLKVGAIGGLKQGVVQGPGRSEYTYLDNEEGAKNATLDAFQHSIEGAFGGAIGAPIGAGIGKVAGKTIGGAGKLGKKLIQKTAGWTGPLLFNLKASVAQHLADHPEAYEKVLGLKQGELAEKMVGSINELSGEVSRNKTAALNKLGDEPTIPIRDVLEDLRSNFFDKFEAIKKTLVKKEVKVKQPAFLVEPNSGIKVRNPDAGKISVVPKNVPHLDSPDGKSVVDEYEALVRMIETESKDGLISERRLAYLAHMLEGFIDREGQGISNDAFKETKKLFVNRIPNQEFHDEMIPIAEATNTLEGMRKMFNLERNFKTEVGRRIDNRYSAKPQTKGTLNQLSENIPAQKAALKFQMYSPEDFINQAQAIKNAPAFDVRKPFVGMLAGGLGGLAKGGISGGLPGALAGAALGTARDIAGPKIMRKIMTSNPGSVAAFGGNAGGTVGSAELTNPILNRYYLGNIVTGETDEEWRARQAKEFEAAAAAAKAAGGQ